MREFFKGWRRKVGLVTLVMALVFTGGWLRSRFFENSVIIPRSSSLWRVASNQYGIHLVDVRTFSTEAAAEVIPPKTLWHSAQIDYSKPAYFDSGEFEWHRKWCGFHFAGFEIVNSQFATGTTLAVPYWFFAIPLTLLSAYLILWKPRQRMEPDHA